MLEHKTHLSTRYGVVVRSWTANATAVRSTEYSAGLVSHLLLAWPGLVWSGLVRPGWLAHDAQSSLLTNDVLVIGVLASTATCHNGGGFCLRTKPVSIMYSYRNSVLVGTATTGTSRTSEGRVLVALRPASRGIVGWAAELVDVSSRQNVIRNLGAAGEAEKAPWK